MTGKPTNLKVHWQPDGESQLTHARCGSSSIDGIIACVDINDITCLKCMDIATRPVKPSEL